MPDRKVAFTAVSKAKAEPLAPPQKALVMGTQPRHGLPYERRQNYMKIIEVKQLLDQGIGVLQIQPVSTTVYNDYSFSSWQTFQINNLLTFPPIAR